VSAILNALRRVQEKRRARRSLPPTPPFTGGHAPTVAAGFREPPFDDTPDPQYFYTNPAHDEATASLLYGIHERKGFITLIGEAGTGKTTLLRKVMADLTLPIHTAFFNTTTLTFDELLDSLCEDFDLPVKEGRRLEKIRALRAFLTARFEDGGTGVLIIDEAHNLAVEVLENLRLLSNLERGNHKLFQIVLAGQPELEKKLGQRELRQLRQRIAVRCWLDRLAAQDVEPYIHHRLRVAGSELRNVFTPEAVRRIVVYSQGVPRLVNTICDNALLRARKTAHYTVSAVIIEEVAHVLRLKRTRYFNPLGIAPALHTLVRQWPRPLAWSSVGILAAALVFGAYNMWVSYGITLPTTRPLAVSRAPVAPRGSERGDRESASQASTLSAPPAPAGPTASSGGEEQALTSATLDGQAGGGRGDPEPPRPTPSLSSQAAATQPVNAPEEGDRGLIAQASNGQNGRWGGQSVTVTPGDLISSIVLKMYGSYSALAFDLIKNFNPHVADLDRVDVGERLWLPPLTRETLLRAQPDGSYQLIVGSFLSALRAREVSQVIERRGYTVVTSPHKVSRTLVVHRVEIVGLSTTEAADQAWQWVSGITSPG
jgi:general secretion pathway protein A